MIKVYTNKENYQYDLHSLIKAFYPEQDVKVYDENALCSENEGNPSDGRVTVRFLTDRMERRNNTHLCIKITQMSQKISINFLCIIIYVTMPGKHFHGEI